jgi:hypothetical protein
VLSMLFLELENVLFRLAGTWLDVCGRCPDFLSEYSLTVWVSWLEMVYFEEMSNALLRSR